MMMETATSYINLLLKHGHLENKTLLSKSDFTVFDSYMIPSHKHMIPCYLAGGGIHG